MARGPIKVPIAADTSGFEKAVKNGIVEPLDDAEDGFKKLEKAAKNADLDKEIGKAEKATEKLDRELDDTRKSLDKLGYAAKKAGDDADAGFDAAGETTAEFKDEARQNFSEVTSSFNGEMSSIVDFAQGTLGGLAGSIAGPLGLALGVAAAGVGLIAGGIEQAAEHEEELRQKAIEFANAAADAGMSVEDWATGAEQVVARLREMEEAKSTRARWFFQDDPSQLEVWADALKNTGRNIDEIGTVLSGSTGAMRDYRDEVEAQNEALLKNLRSSKNLSQAEIERIAEQARAQGDLINLLDDEIDTRTAAEEASKRMADAGESDALRRIEAEEAAAEALDSVKGSVLDAYDSMRDAATTFATDEEGALDISRWLTYTQEHSAAVATYQENLAAMQLTPEQWSNLLEMPEDSRMQWVAQFVALPEAARQPYADALNDIGSTTGSSAAVKFDESFTPDANVTAKAETDKAAKQLDSVATKKRTATIKADVSGEGAAKKTLDALAKKRHATIHVNAETAGANEEINNLVNRHDGRVITLYVNTVRGRKQVI